MSLEFSPFIIFSKNPQIDEIEAAESVDLKIISVISEILKFQVEIKLLFQMSPDGVSLDQTC